MWFLILQILFLMLLAALAGALFAYWWIRRRYEDVTESHDILLRQSAPALPDNLLTRDDLTAFPTTDLDPIQTRLTGLETAFDRFNVPEPDLNPLHSRLTQLEHSLSNVSDRVSDLRNTNLDPVQYRLEQIEQKISGISMPEADLGPIHSGIAQLELQLSDLDFPETDLGPLHTRLASLETRISDLGDRVQRSRADELDAISREITGVSTSIAQLSVPDIDPLHEQLMGVRHAVDAIDLPATDLTPLYDRIERLEATLSQPDRDVQAIYARLAGFEGAIDALDRTPVDLSPVQSRLGQMEVTLTSMRNELHGLDPIEQRVTALQESIMRIPAPDLTPVLTSVHAMDSRMDLTGIEGRLTAIEYGLAALHHTMRTRTETKDTKVTEVQYRAEPAQTEYVQTTTRVEPPAPRAQPAPRRERKTRVTSKDPLGSARRPDDQANLLTHAAFGPSDELEEISGVGPMLRDMLNDIGVYYFWQVAEWDERDIEWVDNKLEHFKGRISRDDWVGQAEELESLPTSATRPAGFDPD